MSTRSSFFSSSVGTKILIALTGLAMTVFLVAHLAGNLLIFVGPEVFNEYSHKLISNPLVYVAEAVLVAIFVLHVFKTVSNWAANRGARPSRYVRKEWTRSTLSRKSWSSTTMIVSGTVVFVFLLLHLKTFKFGVWYVTGDGRMRDLSRLVFELFSNPVWVVFYVVSMVILLMHLRHGVSSALQSLGVNHLRYNRGIVAAGTIIAAVLGVGFAIIPIAIHLLGGRS